MAADIDELRRAIEGLRSEIKSILATYNSNNVEVRQGLVGSERWQSAHEKLDEERWDGIKEKLAELKGMLETIPMKIEEDIQHLRDADATQEKLRRESSTVMWQEINSHGRTISQLKGVWLAVSIGIPALFALLEFYIHGKG